MKSLWILTIAAALSVSAFAQKKQPQIKSQKEQQAWMAVVQATDNDARMKAVDEFLTNFADTELKSVALGIAADAAQRKGDAEKMMIYAERAIEADPQNHEALLMMAGSLAQRTRDFDLDREEKLTRADKYARTALDSVKTLEKPNPQITDEQWEAYKKGSMAQAHEALGLVATSRKKYDVAIASFQEAVNVSPEPNQTAMVRLAQAYNNAGKPDDAIATLDKLAATPNLNPAIKQYMDNERRRSTGLKGVSAPKPAAPATGGTTTTPATPGAGTTTTTPPPAPPATAPKN